MPARVPDWQAFTTSRDKTSLAQERAHSRLADLSPALEARQVAAEVLARQIGARQVDVGDAGDREAHRGGAQLDPEEVALVAIERAHGGVAGRQPGDQLGDHVVDVAPGVGAHRQVVDPGAERCLLEIEQRHQLVAGEQDVVAEEIAVDDPARGGRSLRGPLGQPAELLAGARHRGGEDRVGCGARVGRQRLHPAGDVRRGVDAVPREAAGQPGARPVQARQRGADRARVGRAHLAELALAARHPGKDADPAALVEDQRLAAAGRGERARGRHAARGQLGDQLRLVADVRLALALVDPQEPAPPARLHPVVAVDGAGRDLAPPGDRAERERGGQAADVLVVEPGQPRHQAVRASCAGWPSVPVCW